MYDFFWNFWRDNDEDAFHVDGQTGKHIHIIHMLSKDQKGIHILNLEKGNVLVSNWNNKIVENTTRFFSFIGIVYILLTIK